MTLTDPRPPHGHRAPTRRPTTGSRTFLLALAALAVPGLAIGEGVAMTPTAAEAAVAQEPPPGEGDEGDPLDQTISGDQATATGPAVLAAGHVDLGPRFVDGAWTLMVHDDSGVPSVWRSLDDAVFQVSDTAVQTVPDDPTYGFLGVEPGTPVHVVPQVEVPGVVWLGWNTQDPEVMATVDRGATLSLTGVEGPGEVIMYLQAGNFTEPDVLWDSTAPTPQPIWVEANTHTHANWVFTEPGAYLVEVAASADLIDGSTAEDRAVLRFAVGDATDPETVRQVPLPAAADPVDGSIGDGMAPDAGQGTDSVDDQGLLLALIVGVGVFVATVVVIVGQGARSRRRARRHPAPTHRPTGGRRPVDGD